MDDLFAIYREGCVGSYCDYYANDDMDWPTFNGAALAVYGTLDARYQELLNSATTYGVNH